MTASHIFTAAHAAARLADTLVAYRTRFTTALKSAWAAAKQTLKNIMETPLLPSPPKRWAFQSGAKSYESVVGPYSGLPWTVFNTGTAVNQREVPGDNFGGFLPRPNKPNYELHTTAWFDAQGPAEPFAPGAALGYDAQIHGNWPAFYAKLAEADKLIAEHEQHGYPALVAAHVGPTPAVVVDGTETGYSQQAPAYSPAEQALLNQGLHPSDLGYADTSAQEWLG